MMRLGTGSKGKQSGFTIVELMIATTVFAIVLLLCTYGLLEIGRAYYKGATISRTQEAARTIIDDVAEAIQFNSGQVVVGQPGWHCIGTKRYSYVINRQLTETPANHALVSDTPPSSCSSGTGSQNINGGLSPSSRELLSTRTRISRFDIVQIGDGLYRVTVRVVTGDNNVLVDRNGDNNITPADNPVECKVERAASQYCAAAELTTVVQKRV